MVDRAAGYADCRMQVIGLPILFASAARLMNARVGSPEPDRLDVLATLVEAYEAKQHRRAPADLLGLVVHAASRPARSIAHLGDAGNSR
jgi:hypothetical protein